MARSKRNRRVPARFQDYIPTSAVPAQVGRYLTKKQQLEATRERANTARAEHDHEQLLDVRSDEGDLAVAEEITTSADSFGVFRKYSSLPSHNPDDADAFADVTRSQTLHPLATEPVGSNISISPARSDPDPFTNSENPTRDLLLSWYSNGPTDGIAGFNHLVKCLQHPRFDLSQLKDFTPATAIRQFEKDQASGSALKFGDGWKCGSVTIRLPCTNQRRREEDAPEFTVDGIWYRDAVEVITRELMNPDSFEKIHLKAFEEWWRPTEDSEPVCVYSETYTSDATLELQKMLEETVMGVIGPQLETFLLTALFYSDGTNLAQFGHASLWPLYMFIGNKSKYIRSQPNTFSAHHIAYLPTVYIFFVLFSAHLTSHS